MTCARNERYWKRAASFGAYDGVLRGLVHLLKYDGVRPAARKLGEILAAGAAAIAGQVSAAEILLVPVPLHRHRQGERGFNQAEMIAAHARPRLPPLLGRDVRVETGALIRRRPTDSQVGLTLQQRQEQMRGCFEVAAPARVKGRGVLLVDDVLTTGATASECARVLLRAGAAGVWVLTAARTMRIDVRLEPSEDGSVSVVGAVKV